MDNIEKILSDDIKRRYAKWYEVIESITELIHDLEKEVSNLDNGMFDPRYYMMSEKDDQFYWCITELITLRDDVICKKLFNNVKRLYPEWEELTRYRIRKEVEQEMKKKS